MAVTWSQIYPADPSVIDPSYFITPQRVRITHDGGVTQAILTTPALCEINEILVKCVQASSTATVLIGWASDTDALMTNSEVPKTLNGVRAIRYPVEVIAAATNIIATVGGADSVGEWDVWIRITKYT